MNTDDMDRMEDAQGRLVSVSSIKPEHLIEDGVVRALMTLALGLSEEIAQFRAHATAEVSAHLDLLAEKYGAKRGGKKGNVTLKSFDGSLKVELAIGETITFGPELETAKALLDQYLDEVSAGADEGLRRIVMETFSVNKAGKIDQNRILALRRIEIDHPLWARAMDAIGDAIRPAMSREYFRFYRRQPGGRYEGVPLAITDV
ncbi:uncharacterized protein DUF3164 [Zavarzinia compransoris]|nr:uncharacterized protein DUF3164 [Zavarzinia compransoris]